MIKIFIIWLMFQLVVIGIAGVSIYNEIIDKTYDCPKGEKISVIYGAIFPLAFFVTEDRYIVEYCN